VRAEVAVKDPIIVVTKTLIEAVVLEVVARKVTGEMLVTNVAVAHALQLKAVLKPIVLKTLIPTCP